MPTLTTTAGDIHIVFDAEHGKEPVLFAMWGGTPTPDRHWPFATLNVTAGGGAQIACRGAAVFRQGAWNETPDGFRVDPSGEVEPTKAQVVEARFAVLDALKGVETSTQALLALEGARRLRQLLLHQQSASAAREEADRQQQIADLE